MLSLTNLFGDWSDRLDGIGEDEFQRDILSVVALVAGSDRISGGWTNDQGSRIGEDGEGQGGEDGKGEGTHCNECGGVKESVGGVE